MQFENIKLMYTKVRNNEKNGIIDKLLENGFVILTMTGEEAKRPHLTGSGDSNYGDSSKNETYDLSNWKWISARNEKLSLDLVISLQTFDIDPVTKNRHVLMDRIGLYIYYKNKYNAIDCFENMLNTGIDLPMDSKKFDRLLKIIDVQSEKFLHDNC